MSRNTRTLTRAIAGSATAALLLTTTAPAALAHVTVKPESTTGGTFTQLVFRTPNESDTARTTKLKVTLPADTPLLHVSVLPITGWTAKVVNAPLAEPVDSFGTTVTEAPRTVTWTADPGTGVEPGEYQNFAISAGPLPDSGTLVFPAVQTYSDGEVVRWATVAAEGEEEPEHPAPTFTITAAVAPAGSDAADANVESDSDEGTDPIAVAGLVAGLVALVLAGVALARGRRGREA